MSTTSSNVNWGDVSDVHQTIDSILSPPKDDADVAPGTIKAYTDLTGSITIARKQLDGSWQIRGSDKDVYGIDLTPNRESDIVDDMDTNKPNTKRPNKTALIPNADAYLDHNLNVLLIGLHGTGKTVSIMDLAAERGLKFKYYSCSTLDPYTDLVGVPTPRDYCPECKLYFKDQSKCPDCGGKTVESLKMVRPREVDEAEIIFFDEFNRADGKTQNALFEIMQFKSINGDPLPNLKACWAAINPPDDEQNYQVEQLDPALLDRFDIYIEITPKPSVAYMSRHMPQQIAAVLKNWWEQHQEAITRGAKDKHSDYISPRRLEKIGLVWCATKNTRSVYATLPIGGHFEKTKLVDMLKAAQEQIDNNNGVSGESVDYDDYDDEDFDADSIGDRPASQFTYKLAPMRLQADEIAEFLTKHPLKYATHDAVTSALRQGVGGEELVLRYGKIINALNPSSLEGLVTGFPDAKVTQMRRGFIRLHNDDPSSARELTSLYKQLDKGAKTSDWPSL